MMLLPEGFQGLRTVAIRIEGNHQNGKVVPRYWSEVSVDVLQLRGDYRTDTGALTVE